MALGEGAHGRPHHLGPSRPVPGAVLEDLAVVDRPLADAAAQLLAFGPERVGARSEHAGQLGELCRRDRRTEAVLLPQVLHQSGRTLGPSRREVVVERWHDAVARIVEHDVVTARASHAPRPVAHGDAVDRDGLVVEDRLAPHPARLVDLRPVVGRRLPRVGHRREEGFELEVHADVLALVTEPVAGARLQAVEVHPPEGATHAAEVVQLGERLVPVPVVGRDLPGEHGRVVEHAHPAELHADVGPHHEVPVAHETTLGHHPREPGGPRPPRLVVGRQVRSAVLREQSPLAAHRKSQHLSIRDLRGLAGRRRCGTVGPRPSSARWPRACEYPEADRGGAAGPQGDPPAPATLSPPSGGRRGSPRPCRRATRRGPRRGGRGRGPRASPWRSAAPGSRRRT